MAAVTIVDRIEEDLCINRVVRCDELIPFDL